MCMSSDAEPDVKRQAGPGGQVGHAKGSYIGFCWSSPRIFHRFLLNKDAKVDALIYPKSDGCAIVIDRDCQGTFMVRFRHADGALDHVATGEFTVAMVAMHLVDPSNAVDADAFLRLLPPRHDLASLARELLPRLTRREATVIAKAALSSAIDAWVSTTLAEPQAAERAASNQLVKREAWAQAGEPWDVVDRRVDPTVDCQAALGLRTSRDSDEPQPQPELLTVVRHSTTPHREQLGASSDRDGKSERTAVDVSMQGSEGSGGVMSTTKSLGEIYQGQTAEGMAADEIEWLPLTSVPTLPSEHSTHEHSDDEMWSGDSVLSITPRRAIADDDDGGCELFIDYDCTLGSEVWRDFDRSGSTVVAGETSPTTICPTTTKKPDHFCKECGKVVHRKCYLCLGAACSDCVVRNYETLDGVVKRACRKCVETRLTSTARRRRSWPSSSGESPDHLRHGHAH